MAKLVMEMARESYDIGVICLSQWPQSTEGGFRRVPKTAPRARQLLVDTELPVSRIAELVGYADAAYFSRLFARRAGVSPSRHRSQFTRGRPPA